MNKLNILYEDNHIIVVVKPYNIPVQEDSSKDKDLITYIKEYLKKKYKKTGNVYLGLVHRLDRPVGGVMVFAKTSKAASRLSEQIRSNSMKKRYIALVHNKTKENDILVDYISKDSKTFMSKIDSNGKKAVLEYKLIKYVNNMSLLDINLITGRHHQIRLQLSSRGFPIYGDQRYGIDKEGIQIHLWAYKIGFIHPITKNYIEFVYYPNFYDKYVKKMI